jgi:hypothetical protein
MKKNEDEVPYSCEIHKIPLVELKRFKGYVRYTCRKCRNIMDIDDNGEIKRL